MKIYYASQSFYPLIGGVSTHLLNLCREMVRMGNSVVEVHLRPSGEINKEEIEGIDVHRVPKEPIDNEIMNAYSKFKEAIYKECHYKINVFDKSAEELEGFNEFNKVNEYFGNELRELLEENPADVVHIHDFQLLFTYRYVPRGTPLILTWHIPFSDNISKPLKEFLIKNLNEYDKVVFSSPEYIEAAVKAGLPREKTELIYPIADTNLFKPIDVDRDFARKKYNIQKDAAVILCVQRIDPKSGHEQLIKSMPEVLKKVPDAKLVFVGSKSLSNRLSKEREILENKIKQLVKNLGLENNVMFIGNVEYKRLPELYNSAELVALCSKNEGFGLSVTEGMSCGRPLIGTEVGGIPLQIKNGENGILVDVGDVKSTAQSIVRILTDNALRESMSKKSLDIANKNFKIESGIEKHLMLYNNLKKNKDEFHKIEYYSVSDFKAIVTDLDRTITDRPCKPDFDPDDFDKGLIGELQNLNIDLFLATGRTLDYVKDLCREFNAWRCVVAENGSALYFPRTKKTAIIDTPYMAKARKIIKSLNLPGTTTGKVITSNRAEHEALIKNKLGKLSEKVNFIKNVDEVMITPLGIDKGIGLRIAMQYLNIDMEKVLIVGDAENDIDMFLITGFKIALKNSDEKLKKLANQVIDQPSTKGIREIIKKLKQQ